MNTINITIIASSKSGTLSSVTQRLFECGMFLIKQGQKRVDDKKKQFTLCLEIEHSYSKKEITNVLNSLPEIYSVDSILIKQSSETHNKNKSKMVLNSYDTITKESLQIVEEYLLDILGPSAPLLVQTAASETNHIGDLFNYLSKELAESDRNIFLNLIDG